MTFLRWLYNRLIPWGWDGPVYTDRSMRTHRTYTVEEVLRALQLFERRS